MPKMAGKFYTQAIQRINLFEFVTYFSSKLWENVVTTHLYFVSFHGHNMCKNIFSICALVLKIVTSTPLRLRKHNLYKNSHFGDIYCLLDVFKHLSLNSPKYTITLVTKVFSEVISIINYFWHKVRSESNNNLHQSQ